MIYFFCGKLGYAHDKFEISIIKSWLSIEKGS